MHCLQFGKQRFIDEQATSYSNWRWISRTRRNHENGGTWHVSANSIIFTGQALTFCLRTGRHQWRGQHQRRR